MKILLDRKTVKMKKLFKMIKIILHNKNKLSKIRDFQIVLKKVDNYKDQRVEQKKKILKKLKIKNNNLWKTQKSVSKTKNKTKIASN